MDLSPHKIQRITQWIQSEVNYNFSIRVIQLLLMIIKFYLSKMTKNLNKFALIAYWFQDI